MLIRLDMMTIDKWITKIGGCLGNFYNGNDIYDKSLSAWIHKDKTDRI